MFRRVDLPAHSVWTGPVDKAWHNNLINVGLSGLLVSKSCAE